MLVHALESDRRTELLYGLKVGNKYFENMTTFERLGATGTNQNGIQEEIRAV